MCYWPRALWTYLPLSCRWGKDPYSWGSYSYIAKGGSSTSRANLGKPVCFSSGKASLCTPTSTGLKLFFAGEAVSVENAGTAHGALDTGKKTAADILAALKLR